MLNNYKGCLLGLAVGEALGTIENSDDIDNTACEMFRIFKEQPSEWLHD